MLHYRVIKDSYSLNPRFYANTIPLTEITITEKKLKQLTPQKSYSLIPIEQIRFWRRHELLPFFEDGKHAQVSMGQFLWLRFLQILKHFGCTIKYMQNASNYFIKRAYDDDLIIKNLLSEKEQLASVVLKDNSTKVKDTEELIVFTKRVLSDPILLHSIKMEVNYFTTLIVYSLSSGKSVDIVMDQLGQFAVRIDNTLYNPTIDKFETTAHIAIDEPLICIPIRSLLNEFFDDPKIEADSFNVKVLSDKEQDIIRAIRNKSISRITIKTQNGEVKRFDMEKVTKKSMDDTGIKEIKKILGLKNYLEVKCTALNEKEVIIVKNIKRVYE